MGKEYQTVLILFEYFGSDSSNVSRLNNIKRAEAYLVRTPGDGSKCLTSF